MYPLNKYRYYTNGKKIIAVSTYAGKPVRGVASCSPNDAFNLETGKELAAARCAEKIALKREKRATEKFEEAKNLLSKAQDNYRRMWEYYKDASENLDDACDYLKDIYNTLL